VLDWLPRVPRLTDVPIPFLDPVPYLDPALRLLPRVPLLSDIPIPFVDRVPYLDRALLVLRVLPASLSAARLLASPTTTVADRIEAQARARGDHPFVSFEGRQMTYGEWNAAANRVAHWACGQGFAKGTTVALLMENRPEFLAAWAGLAKVGATIALINTNLHGAQLRHAIDAASARHLIVGSELSDRLESVAADGAGDLAIWFAVDPADRAAAPKRPAGAEDLDAALAAEPATNPDPSVRKDLRTDDNLFYIYTSGTTGLPKAARFSHLRFLLTGDFTASGLQLRSDDVHYCALPLYHTAGGVMVVSSAVSAGATIALRRKFSASQFFDDVRRQQATCFQYIGEFCRYLLNQPERPNDREHRLRLAIGNGLRPDIWEAFQRRFAIPQIVEFYGATEGNTVLVNLENKVGSVGRYPIPALANGKLVRFDVESESHERDARGLCVECAPGEIGELVAPVSETSPLGRFEGYTSKADSEKKMLRDVFAPGDACFRTGDLLRQDAEGFFYFVDRIGDTFRWKGENVSTQEVAEAISSCSGVEMVNVYGVAIEGMDGRAGMAAIRLAEGAALDGRAFYDFVDRCGLPRYAAPIFVRLLAEVDMTGTFKLRKVELQKEGFDPARISDPLFVRDDGVRAYVPVTPAVADEIRSGARRP
jgi:fatty-acyl-CoA synthase